MLDRNTDRRKDSEREFLESIALLAPCDENAADCGVRHNALGNLLVSMGRAADARKQLDTAMAFMSSEPDSTRKARIFDNYAYLYREQAEFDRAESYWSRPSKCAADFSETFIRKSQIRIISWHCFLKKRGNENPRWHMYVKLWRSTRRSLESIIPKP